MNNQSISQKNIQKLMKESFKATSVIAKNREIIETLLSIQEIKEGNCRKYLSAEEMFEKLGI